MAFFWHDPFFVLIGADFLYPDFYRMPLALWMILASISFYACILLTSLYFSLDETLARPCFLEFVSPNPP